MPAKTIGLRALGAALLLASCGTQSANQSSSRSEAEVPLVSFARLSSDPIVHGERVARVLGCTGCHGDDLTGIDWSDPGFERLWTSNLTRAVPRYDDASLKRAIRGGRRYDGSELWAMPSHLFTHLADADMSALIAWLRTRAPTGDDRPLPQHGPVAIREIQSGNWRSSAADVRADGARWPPDTGTTHILARYIVRGTCAECHGLSLEGDRDQDQDRPAPPLAVVAAYNQEQFQHLLRTGEPIGGRQLRLMSEVARERYSQLTDAEIDAVFQYLQSAARAAQSR